VTIDDDVMQVFASGRDALGIETEDRGNIQTFQEMLKVLREKIEETGTLVFVSGIVDSNARRTLDAAVFRGFTLSDDCAPVIFVNGADLHADP
jgi:hypothetical protein